MLDSPFRIGDAVPQSDFERLYNWIYRIGEHGRYGSFDVRVEGTDSNNPYQIVAFAGLWFDDPNYRAYTCDSAITAQVLQRKIVNCRSLDHRWRDQQTAQRSDGIRQTEQELWSNYSPTVRRAKLPYVVLVIYKDTITSVKKVFVRVPLVIPIHTALQRLQRVAGRGRPTLLN